MKVRFIAPLVMALCLGASLASAQSIGVFFDPNGASCEAVQLPFAPGTIYVLALTGGPTADGITGAEFRVDGVPGAWFPSATANPAAAVTVGGPLTGGCNIAFASCMPGTVLLYTINYFVTSVINDVTVSVLRHTTPSNPDFVCPSQVECNAPIYTQVCCGGGQAFINPVGRHCTVAVQPSSWSQVKGLYNN